jgi:polyphosphate kinase 2 (PPK2 family)
MQAYRDTVARCDMPWAPWVVVAANRKWYRNLVVARELVRTLEKIRPRYPKVSFDPKAIRIP